MLQNIAFVKLKKKTLLSLTDIPSDCNTDKSTVKYEPQLNFLASCCIRIMKWDTRVFNKPY